MNQPITTVGRAELLEMIAERDRRITELQTRMTQMVYERRVLPLLEQLQLRIAEACQKHPTGPGRDLRTLVEEVGEVASAIRREGPERVRDELLDVACVAIRMMQEFR